MKKETEEKTKQKRHPLTESEKRHNKVVANQNFERKAYDKVLVRIRKDTEPTRATITAAAERRGLSLNGYIMTAVENQLERDGVDLAALQAASDGLLPADQNDVAGDSTITKVNSDFKQTLSKTEANVKQNGSKR